MKRVLMVAYHFPPLVGSSGIQRTLRFVRYLPEFGWQPWVLTAHSRAYEQVSDDQLSDIPSGVEVLRAPAWDTSRHLAISGHYPRFMALPDRWVSWWLGGSWRGLAASRRIAFDAIWSTYPIATAHMIGATLAKRAGLPWIADFRDPMAQPDYPVELKKRKYFAQIERTAVNNATFNTFTTPSAVETYRMRYPARADSIRLIENGYDEEAFRDIEATGPIHPGRLTLLHSGIVYPEERNPTQLFAALGRLRQSWPEAYRKLIVRFRAPIHDRMLKELARRYSVEDAIEIRPPVKYREALQEMCGADGLLVLQAANCNAQIPAKLYEYMRAGRPLLLLTDPGGDTAGAARLAGVNSIARLDDPKAIVEQLIRFTEQPTAGTIPSDVSVSGASRRERARQLASLLDSLEGGG